MDELLAVINEISRVNSRISSAGLVFGEVTSTSPLKIKLDGSYEIGEEFIVLSGFCKETRIRVPQNDDYEHVHEEEESLGYVSGAVNGSPVLFTMSGSVPTQSLKLTHKHVIKKALPEILLWRGLQVGDRVRMIRLGMGQIHYVFERLEGITNDPE